MCATRLLPLSFSKRVTAHGLGVAAYLIKVKWAATSEAVSLSVTICSVSKLSKEGSVMNNPNKLWIGHPQWATM